MAPTLDLGPAAHRMTSLLDAVTDDQLAAPTPCSEYTLGQLIDHVGGLAVAFTAAATKDYENPPAHVPTVRDADWRSAIARQLAALADAWRRPEAWQGMTRAGGVDLPADVACTVAMNELVVHGWDVARASGQSFDPDPDDLDACVGFVSLFSGPGKEEDRGDAFGPVVDVPADAPLLDRLIGMNGRDPAWRSPATS